MHLNRASWLGALALITAGLLIGLSFIATPVKFMAAGIGVAELLQVGRVTFRASLGVETVCVFGLLVLARGKARGAVVACAFILAAQHVMLMPALDARTLAIISGNAVPPSSLHMIWIIADMVRVLIYLMLGASSLMAAEGVN